VFRLLAGSLLGAWLVWFVVRNFPKIQVAAQLPAREWLLLLPVLAAEFVSLTVLYTVLLRAQQVQLGYGRLVLLTAASRFLNLVPMKLGSVLKARYLKSETGLKYSAFVVVMLAQIMLSVLAVTIVFLPAFVAGRLPSTLRDVTVVGLALSFTACLVARIRFVRSARLPALLSTSLAAWQRIAADYRVLASAVAIACLRLGIHAVRFSVLVGAAGLACGWSELVLISAAGELGMIGLLTPHGIGQREALIGAAALGLGLPPDAFVAVAVVDRCLLTVGMLVVGLLPACWLWRQTVMSTPLPLAERTAVCEGATAAE
jgi:uncharacterized membrane protein YbhN (UPF0104 family)